MKTWKIFLVGMFAIAAGFLLPMYERFIAGTTAVLVVVAVAFGFWLRPRKEILSARTAVPVWEVDRFVVEHGQIAAKIELARLWLLFIPTLIAVAFLVATAAQGSTWNFSLFDWFGRDRFGGCNPVGFYIFRALLFFVAGVLSAWLSERWVLRDAEACSLRSLTVRGGRASYAFVDSSGGYYGGDGLVFGKVRSRQLAGIAVYRKQKPEQNKIPLSCLFHRFIIIGQGLTDLDTLTSEKHSLEIVPEQAPSQSCLALQPE